VIYFSKNKLLFFETFKYKIIINNNILFVISFYIFALLN